MQFINPQVGNFYAERVQGGMSTGRFRFSIAQPVRKNHPPRPRLSVWAGAGSRRLRAAAAPLLQSGYIMGYYVNILCPAARAPDSRGRWCACVRCLVRLLAMFHGLALPPHQLPPTACRPWLPRNWCGLWGLPFPASAEHGRHLKRYL